MLVEPGNIYVNEQKLQHGPRFATMAIAAQAGFWRLRDWGLAAMDGDGRIPHISGDIGNPTWNILHVNWCVAPI